MKMRMINENGNENESEKGEVRSEKWEVKKWEMRNEK